MSATAFDAALDFEVGDLGPDGRAAVVLGGRRVPAVLVRRGMPKADPGWALVTAGEPLDARWHDAFEVVAADGHSAGRGVVLFPSPPPDLKPPRRRELLERLSGGEEGMVLVLAELAGIRGLGADEVAAFSRLAPARVEEIARGLESEAKVRILSFSPLSFVLQESLDFLRRRIATYLGQYHKKHPAQRTVPLARIEKRFGVAANVLNLALRALAKEGRVSLAGGEAELVGYRPTLSAEDEALLARMESLVLEGEFGRVSLDGLSRRLRLSPGRLQRLLAELMERKKIVEGPDGFIVHQRWLDEVVEKVRGSGRRELTVADFKALTGLTRKYAIPLLELLDEMGVTRRKGAARDVLR
ncbi:MAG TPA: SelB C-terminal domain-containing protein [Terriglobales bacterium]|nr:SelB C-terminal domain-containing protein [Terriglobales bacterium]